ncbi:MAG TPA: Ran-binding zinc finger domain-containing protein [Gemmatimonadaceae bacterium]
MTKAGTNSEQTVEALLAERQRYDAWLAALEARRASTPSHIYDRVHADYTARLQRVVEQLSSQRSALQKLEHALMDRLTSLDVEEAQHRDEAAEAELRAAVGELTPKEHDEVVTRTQAALASIAEAREAAIPELTRIRAVLARGADETDADADSKEADKDEVPAAPRSNEERAVPVVPAVPSGFDELTFLKSLVESPASPGEEGANSAPRSSANGREPAREAERERVQSSAPPQAVAEDEAEPEAPEPAPARVRRTGPTLDVQHEESPHLKGMQADQVKTLKCQECGTFNYPTEWYCERCGAELAAL